MQINTVEAKIRILTELVILLGAFLYLVSAVVEARFLGLRMFFENLVLYVGLY